MGFSDIDLDNLELIIKSKNGPGRPLYREDLPSVLFYKSPRKLLGKGWFDNYTKDLSKVCSNCGSFSKIERHEYYSLYRYKNTICSSAAVIPVTTKCTLKSGVSEDMANFVIPICSNTHMCGSTIKLVTTSVAVAYMFGVDIPLALFINFALMQAIAAVSSPGVMGGVLMASVGLLGTILGFSAEMTALLMAIYLALDGYGPACNVSGDGAIAIVMDKLFGKKTENGELKTEN